MNYSSSCNYRNLILFSCSMLFSVSLSPPCTAHGPLSSNEAGRGGPRAVALRRGLGGSGSSSSSRRLSASFLVDRWHYGELCNHPSISLTRSGISRRELFVRHALPRPPQASSSLRRGRWEPAYLLQAPVTPSPSALLFSPSWTQHPSWLAISGFRLPWNLPNRS